MLRTQYLQKQIIKVVFSIYLSVKLKYKYEIKIYLLTIQGTSFFLQWYAYEIYEITVFKCLILEAFTSLDDIYCVM